MRRIRRAGPPYTLLLSFPLSVVYEFIYRWDAGILVLTHPVDFCFLEEYLLAEWLVVREPLLLHELVDIRRLHSDEQGQVLHGKHLLCGEQRIPLDFLKILQYYFHCYLGNRNSGLVVMPMDLNALTMLA